MTAATRARPSPKRLQRRNVTINLRATEAWRALVDDAAQLLETTRTDFIIEATTRHAEDVLLDQRNFALDTNRYRAFLAILDRPPLPNEELKSLLRRKAPWQT